MIDTGLPGNDDADRRSRSPLVLAAHVVGARFERLQERIEDAECMVDGARLTASGNVVGPSGRSSPCSSGFALQRACAVAFTSGCDALSVADTETSNIGVHLSVTVRSTHLPPGGLVKELPKRRVQASGGSVRAHERRGRIGVADGRAEGAGFPFEELGRANSAALSRFGAKTLRSVAPTARRRFGGG